MSIGISKNCNGNYFTKKAANTDRGKIETSKNSSKIIFHENIEKFQDNTTDTAKTNKKFRENHHEYHSETSNRNNIIKYYTS